VACLWVDTDDFSSSRRKLFVWRAFFREKKDTCNLSSVFFFFARKLAKQNVLPTDDEKLSASAICKPHTQEKSQDTATFTEDVITNTEHTSELETSIVCTRRTC
jgi:hypothetical protein